MKNDPLLHKEKVKSLMLRCNLVKDDVQIEIKTYFNNLGVKDGIFIPGKLSDRVTCLETIGDISKKLALHF